MPCLLLAAWSHPYMTAMTNEEAFAELYYSKKAIHDVLGITVQCWRPPFGDVDDRIRYIANELGLRTIIWDQDTNDWDYSALGVKAIETNYKNIMNGNYSTQGTVVLSHEIDNETMALSEQFLPSIREKFTGGVMPVGVCQNWTQPYGEGSEYQYPNYAQWVAGTRSVTLIEPTAVSKEVAFATDAVVTSSGLPQGASTVAVTTTTAAASGASGTAAAASRTASSPASSATKSSPTQANALAGTSSASSSAAVSTEAASGAGARQAGLGAAAAGLVIAVWAA